MKKILLLGLILLSSISFVFAQDANGHDNVITNSLTGTAIGSYTESQASYSMAAGFYSKAMSNGSFALGNHVHATAANSWIIGSGYLKGLRWVEYTNPNSNSLMIGFNMLNTPSFFVEPFDMDGSGGGFVGIHTDTPTSTLEVNGTLTTKGLRVVSETLIGSNWVLTADGTDGSVKWAAPTGSGIGSSYTHPAHTGMVGSAGDGNTWLNVSAIEGQIYTSSLSSTDKLIFARSGSQLKSTKISDLKNYMQNNLDFGSGGGGTVSPWVTSGSNIYRSSGNVGIGISSPQEKLHVNGTIQVEDGIKMIGATNKIVFGESSNSIFQIAKNVFSKGVEPPSAGTQAVIFTIDANNRVGIGTDSPTAQLDVNGTAKINNTLTVTGEIFANDNVEIAQSLDVSEDISVAGKLQFGTGLSQITFGSYNTAKTFKILSNFNPPGKGLIQGIAISSSGRVGIGIDNPGAMLDVNGDIIVQGGINVNGTTKTNGIQMTNGAVDGYILQSNASGVASWVQLDIPTFESPWTVSGGNIYRESGKVGIGIEPTSKELEVNGDVSLNSLICGSTRATNSNYFTIRGSELSGSSRILIGKQESGENHIKIVAKGNDGAISFSPGGLTRIVMRSDEFVVGFPDTDGSRLMDFRVNGKIWTNEVEVLASGWWDHVFSEDYELRSIEEVELFINENSHLPDIPSEEEVMQNGINLGEMDGLLLKKIEELTLYIIQQQKEIEDLKILVKSSK